MNGPLPDPEFHKNTVAVGEPGCVAEPAGTATATRSAWCLLPQRCFASSGSQRHPKELSRMHGCGDHTITIMAGLLEFFLISGRTVMRMLQRDRK